MKLPKLNDIGKMDRTELVEWIEKLAGDELENKSDWIEISKSRLEQLKDQLKYNCRWYNMQ